MIEDPNERLIRALTGRELEVTISVADEHRLRMWVDRYNAEIERAPWGTPDDMLDPDKDHDLKVALMTCISEGLRVDENEHGLESFIWGDVVSKEVADEIRRRGRV